MASRALKIDPKKSTPNEPKHQPEISPSSSGATPNAGAVEVRAYELWVERGCPIGSPEVDWYQAVRELSR